MRRKHAILLVAALLAIVAGLGAYRYLNPPLIWALDDHSFAMIVPPDQSAEEAIRRGREACAPVARSCHVVGWNDRDSAPRDMREWFDPAKIDAEVFSYRISRDTSPVEETAGFSCRRFPATPRQSCFEYGTVEHPAVPIHLTPATGR